MNVDPFIDYPFEMIIRICNELDTPTLLNASEASSRIYQACSDIITKRRNEYQAEKQYRGKIELYKNYIKHGIESYDRGRFRKIFPDGLEVMILISIILGGKIYIKQYIDQFKHPCKNLNTSWIFSDRFIEYHSFARYIEKEKSENLFDDLAKNLVDQGYEILLLKIQ